jgi:Zinc finger, C2H2 type
MNSTAGTSSYTLRAVPQVLANALKSSPSPPMIVNDTEQCNKGQSAPGLERHSSMTSATTPQNPITVSRQAELRYDHDNEDDVSIYACKRRNYWSTVLRSPVQHDTTAPDSVFSPLSLLPDLKTRDYGTKPKGEINKRPTGGFVASSQIKVKRFACRDCKSRFAGRIELTAHIDDCVKKSNAEHSFVCEHCSASFRKSSNQVMHIALVEKKLRPFTCSICPSSFGQKSNLTSHIRITRMSSS